jgi:hypothetical protein
MRRLALKWLKENDNRRLSPAVIDPKGKMGILELL